MLYWYCGGGLVHLLKKPHYFDHLGVINLWLRHNKNIGRFFFVKADHAKINNKNIDKVDLESVKVTGIFSTIFDLDLCRSLNV